MTGRTLGVALILWPFASALLLGLHRAGRALHNRIRRSSTVTEPLCGLPHYGHPESTCIEPAGHYVRDRDPHAAPLIIDGREVGAVAWNEPAHPPTGVAP